MSSVIDHETLYVDDLPGIWSPVQWELTEAERIEEIENQATASLLYVVDAPEAILRLLLNETAIERAFGPPDGYKPEEQGEWDNNLITYQFSRPVRLVNVQHAPDSLYVEYDLGDLGHWAFVVEADKVSLERI
jgi:hypothetical protein